MAQPACFFRPRKHHRTPYQRATYIRHGGKARYASDRKRHEDCNDGSDINEWRKQGFGWSWLFCHSFVLLRCASRFPPLANINILMQELSKEYADTEMFLMDLWPSYPSSIPIAGGPSILSFNSSDWNQWRSLLNPGFSAQSLMNHVPFIVGSVQIFSDKLRASVGKGVFFLGDYATRLNFDVIMKVTLDSDINYQFHKHILPTAVNTTTRWHSFWDPRILMNQLRPVIQKYYGRKMESCIDKELHRQFQGLKAERKASDAASGNSKRPLSVISLALESYIDQNKEKNILETATLDRDFARSNDTTSATIVFALHLMSKHSEACSQLRKEHDSVFGTDVSKTAKTLKAQPSLLNQCRYTLAFVKETLRIYPPGGNMRLGTLEATLLALNGKIHPTERLNIVLANQPIHMNPRIWVKPNEFLPERFLVEPGLGLYPPNGEFRPFDIGPRRCIGQELSLTEIRTVLIMTARVYDFNPEYEE
ncbi:cytochrome P450 [Lentithecium fluviatile CBS 122367]|uniref:Cytochrome P450 n=1 Tax=Lentithecium fluviatile CBS 122367 TaxID=1168545 RepID=A0A6G1ICA3_9PLEO|nr:cytochrome P450 [Lentithecium fluviatile CBS 122367]